MFVVRSSECVLRYLFSETSRVGAARITHLLIVVRSTLQLFELLFGRFGKLVSFFIIPFCPQDVSCLAQNRALHFALRVSLVCLRRSTRHLQSPSDGLVHQFAALSDVTDEHVFAHYVPLPVMREENMTVGFELMPVAVPWDTF